MPKLPQERNRKQKFYVEILLQGGFGNQLFQLMSVLENYPGTRVCLNAQVLRPRLNIEGVPELVNLRLPSEIKVKHGPRNLLFKMFNSSYLIRSLSLEFLNKSNSTENSIFKARLFLLRVLFSIYTFRIVSFDIEGKRIFESRHRMVLGYFQRHKSFSQSSVTRVKEILNNCKISIAESRAPARVDNGTVLGVHIRRGDYESNPKFGILTREYYKSALALIENQMELDQVWIFAEENSLERELLSVFSEKYLVSVVSNKSITSEIATLQKMGECDAFIMANSTFSWWGAIMVANQSRVVAPIPWFRSNSEFEPTVSPTWLRVQSHFESN